VAHFRMADWDSAATEQAIGALLRLGIDATSWTTLTTRSSQAK